MERSRRRAQEINSMRREGQPRILQRHLFHAAKYLQRRILATAIEDPIKAKQITGKNARKDGYHHLPVMVKKYGPK